MNCLVKTSEMFEFASWEESTLEVGMIPTTTKRIDRVKKDEGGNALVKCQLAACDFNPRREVGYVSGVGEKGREKSHGQVKLVFTDMKNAHFNATCEEEEWVELPEEVKKCGRAAKSKRWL